MKKIIYDNNKNVIYAKLRYYRKQRKLTQNELAAKLQVMGINIDQRGISRMERNLRMVTDYELACLCKALHIPEKELLSDFYEGLEA